MKFRATIVALALASAFVVASGSAAQGNPRGVAVSALRMLSYDQALPRRGPVQIGVLYDAGDASSEEWARRLARAYAGSGISSLQGQPLSATPVAFSSAAQLRTDVERGRLTVLHLSSGLDRQVNAIAAVARDLSIPLVASDDSYVRSGGAAVGVGDGRGRARLVVHLPESRRQGMALQAALLRIATVLR